MATAREPLRFEGSVDALEGLVPVPPGRRRAIAVDLEGKAGRTVAPRVLTASAGGSWTSVRLVLPEDTPPGEYEATVSVDDDRFPAVLRVPAQPRVVVVPHTVSATLPPDGTATVTLVVANTGNAPVTVPRTVAVGLFDVSGLDRAIGDGLSSQAQGVDRLGVVADTLAGNHGGMLRVAVRSGSGEVAPGGSTTLTCELRASGRLAEGRAYFGYWTLADATTTVRVSVEAPATPRRRGSATVTDLPRARAAATPRTRATTPRTTKTSAPRGSAPRTTTRTRKDPS